MGFLRANSSSSIIKRNRIVVKAHVSSSLFPPCSPLQQVFNDDDPKTEKSNNHAAAVPPQPPHCNKFAYRNFSHIKFLLEEHCTYTTQSYAKVLALESNDDDDDDGDRSRPKPQFDDNLVGAPLKYTIWSKEMLKCARWIF